MAHTRPSPLLALTILTILLANRPWPVQTDARIHWRVVSGLFKPHQQKHPKWQYQQNTNGVSHVSKQPPPAGSGNNALAAAANQHHVPPASARDKRTARDIRRVCYFRMDPKTDIRLDQVDGTLCTHLILAFARINADGQLEVASDSDYAYLNEVAAFKRRFSHVRVMISVFNEPEFNGFPRLASAASNADQRLKFARSAIEFLQRYQLDGLDLDWEFPNFPTSFLNSREHERAGLIKILKALRSTIVENYFDRQLAEQQQLAARNSASLSAHTSTLAIDGNNINNANSELHVEPHLLTVAIGGQEAILRSSYELRQMSNLCDWLNVMSYDYFLFKAYSPFTGPNSPLFPIVEPYVPILGKLSLSWTISRLLEEGLDESKLVMGVPCYARAYRLLFRNTQAAPFTLSAGAQGGQIEDYLNYREVLDALRRDDTVAVHFDQRARVPYLLTEGGYLWISYENDQSVREKVRHILNSRLGGYMTWNLNSDDFLGAGGTQTTTAAGVVERAEQVPLASDNWQQAPGAAAAVTFPLHRAMLDEVLKFFTHSAS